LSERTGPGFTATLRDGAAGPVVEASGDLGMDGAPLLRFELKRALAVRPRPPSWWSTSRMSGSVTPGASTPCCSRGSMPSLRA
jgi:hypothetical protein